MTDESFAAACAAIDRLALVCAHKLPEKPLSTKREDVESVVRMARWAWRNHHDDPVLRAIIDLEVR